MADRKNRRTLHHLPLAMKHHREVKCVVFSRDGLRLASGGDDFTVWVWDACSGRSLNSSPMCHDNAVDFVAFSPDGLLLASGCVSGWVVQIWDANTGQPLLCTDKMLIRPIDDKRRYWDPLTGQPMWRPDTGEPMMRDPDAARPRRHPKIQYEDRVTCVSFSPNGLSLALGCLDGAVHLWDVRSGRDLRHAPMLHRPWVNCVAFSPDGIRLASGSDDGTIRFWDARTGEMLNIIPLKQRYKVVRLVFSPDGLRLASLEADTQVRIWNVGSGRQVNNNIMDHGHEHISCLAFSPDGGSVLSAGDDFRLKVWAASSGELLNELVLETLPRAINVQTPDRVLLACDGHEPNSIVVQDYRF